jgi:hypothetical protein
MRIPVRHRKTIGSISLGSLFSTLLRALTGPSHPKGPARIVKGGDRLMHDIGG